MANPVNYFYRDQSVSGGSGAFSYITLSSFKYMSYLNGVHAFATGGQTSATPLTAQTNRVTVCATTADSVLLPPAVAGLTIKVINVGAATVAVFPTSTAQGGVSAGGGDVINALSANASFSVAATKSCSFISSVTGQWNTLLSA